MTARYSIIVACANQGVIGYQNAMPWHLPVDLQHFKTLTMGKLIVMGRKTYDSIGRPLPGRRMVVLSQQSQLTLPHADIVHSLTELTQKVQDEAEVMIIGGEQIFRLLMPQVTTVYLTRIHADVVGDTFFSLNPLQWREVARESHQPDARNQYCYDFLTLVKI